jgi:hypothetical protein
MAVISVLGKTGRVGEKNCAKYSKAIPFIFIVYSIRQFQKRVNQTTGE